MKGLLNTYSGFVTIVKDFIETPKRFKVINRDGSHNLWKKDSYDAKIHTVIEGKDSDELFKIRKQIITKRIEDGLAELMEKLDFSKISVLEIANNMYSVDFNWKEIDTSETMHKLNIRFASSNDDEVVEFLMMISKFVNKNILSQKCLFAKTYRTHYGKLVKNREYITENLRRNSDSNVPIFTGLFINKNTVEPLMPDEIIIGERYAIPGRICFEIPNRFDGYSDYPDDSDIDVLPFSVDELSKFSKRVKVICRKINEDDNTKISSFIRISDSYIAITKRPDIETGEYKYSYEHIGSSNVRKIYTLSDQLYELRRDRSLFKFVSGDIEMYLEEDFIINEMSLISDDNFISSGYRLNFRNARNCRAIPLTNTSDLLVERQHHFIVLMNELKKYLGVTGYNSWMLMGELDRR